MRSLRLLQMPPKCLHSSVVPFASCQGPCAKMMRSGSQDSIVWFKGGETLHADTAPSGRAGLLRVRPCVRPGTSRGGDRVDLAKRQ